MRNEILVASKSISASKIAPLDWVRTTRQLTDKWPFVFIAVLTLSQVSVSRSVERGPLEKAENVHVSRIPFKKNESTVGNTALLAVPSPWAVVPGILSTFLPAVKIIIRKMVFVTQRGRRVLA